MMKTLCSVSIDFLFVGIFFLNNKRNKLLQITRSPETTVFNVDVIQKFYLRFSMILLFLLSSGWYWLHSQVNIEMATGVLDFISSQDNVQKESGISTCWVVLFFCLFFKEIQGNKGFS